MARLRKTTRALRRAVRAKTGRRWWKRHAWDRFSRRFSRLLLRYLIYFVLWVTVTVLFSAASFGEINPPYSLASFVAVLVSIVGVLKMISWIHGTLFFARTRFFLAMPTAPDREVLQSRVIGLIPSLLANFFAYTYLAFLCTFNLEEAPSSDLAAYVDLLRSGLICWLGHVGVVGLLSPLIAWKRPVVDFSRLGGRISTPLIILIVVAINFELLRFITLGVEWLSPAVRWLPQTWGILALDYEGPMRDPVLTMVAGGFFAALGGVCFLFTLRILRENLTENQPALLAPHFSHAAIPAVEKKPVTTSSPTPGEMAPPDFRKNLGFLETLLERWLNPEEARALKLNYGERFPRLTSAWVFGTVILLLALVPVAYLANLDRPKELEYFIAYVSIGGCLALALSRLFGSRVKRNAFSLQKIGTTSASAIGGYPVRWTDLFRVELKIAVIKHAAALVPILFFASFAADLMDWSTGLGMLVGFHAQLFFLARFPMSQDQDKRSGFYAKFTSLWFWILLVVRVANAILLVAAGIGSALILMSESLRPLAILPILICGGSSFCIWWFVVRQSYNAVHVSLESNVVDAK